MSLTGRGGDRAISPLYFCPFRHTPDINKIPSVPQSIYFLLQAQVLQLETTLVKKFSSDEWKKGKLWLELYQLILKYNEIKSI